MAFFSIIVPIYNSERTLNRCITSLLSQTYKDFELILINDGSQDSSDSICRNYQAIDSRIKYISQSNSGVSSARNQGLKLATGKWITFCDSDDYVDSQWLETYAITIKDDTDLVVQGFTSVGLQSSTLSSLSFFDASMNAIDSLDCLINNRYLGYLWVKAFKREIIMQHSLSFDENVALKEDELFVLNYYSHIKQVEHSSQCHYYYEVPVYGNKYNDEREFYVLSREFQSIKMINGVATSKIFSVVLIRLTHALFEGYKKEECPSISSLLNYKKIVTNSIILKSSVSFSSKIILLLPSFFSHLLLRCKGQYQKKNQ